MSTNNTELAIRLQSLRDELNQTLTKTRSRRKRTSFILILLVLVIAGYWTYLYKQVTAIDANMVSDLAYVKTMEYVNQQQPVISQALRARAPEIFDYAETKILQAPTTLSDMLKKATLGKTQVVLDNFETQITQLLNDGVTHAKASIDATGLNVNDPKQVDKFIEDASHKLYGDIKVGLNKMYIDYDAKAAELVAYLDRLSAGKDLDVRETHIRNLVISLMSVAAKHNQDR